MRSSGLAPLSHVTSPSDTFARSLHRDKSPKLKLKCSEHTLVLSLISFESILFFYVNLLWENSGVIFLED